MQNVHMYVNLKISRRLKRQVSGNPPAVDDVQCGVFRLPHVSGSGPYELISLLNLPRVKTFECATQHRSA